MGTIGNLNQCWISFKESNLNNEAYESTHNEDSNYNELQEYLNHQESWLESTLGENLAHCLKTESEENQIV